MKQCNVHKLVACTCILHICMYVPDEPTNYEWNDYIDRRCSGACDTPPCHNNINHAVAHKRDLLISQTCQKCFYALL